MTGASVGVVEQRQVIGQLLSKCVGQACMVMDNCVVAAANTRYSVASSYCTRNSRLASWLMSGSISCRTRARTMVS